jgi:hypothetical protein
MPSKISYPHATLTKIEGTPDAASIEKLQKEVYTTNLLATQHPVNYWCKNN